VYVLLDVLVSPKVRAIPPTPSQVAV